MLPPTLTEWVTLWCGVPFSEGTSLRLSCSSTLLCLMLQGGFISRNQALIGGFEQLQLIGIFHLIWMASSLLFHIWKIRSPPRVIAFGLTIILGKFLTQDNLCLKISSQLKLSPCAWRMQSRWIIFFRGVKQPVSYGIQGLASSPVASWFVPGSFLNIFEIRNLAMGSTRSRILWKVSFGHQLGYLEGKECHML